MSFSQFVKISCVLIVFTMIVSTSRPRVLTECRTLICEPGAHPVTRAASERGPLCDCETPAPALTTSEPTKPAGSLSVRVLNSVLEGGR